MKVERVRPSVLCLTLHAYELAALIAAARWAAEKGDGELPAESVEQLPAESVEQLRQVLASYDVATRGVSAADA